MWIPRENKGFDTHGFVAVNLFDDLLRRAHYGCATTAAGFADSGPEIGLNKAVRTGRFTKFGYRVHVIVRETEDEARNAAAHLISAVDAATGDAIRSRSLDSSSIGVRRQAELRESAGSDGFVEPHLWTGIGKARSGCGAAIVGTPQQVIEKIHRYEAMGIEAFIFSGYPHKQEAQRFAELVLPHLNHGPL